MLACTSSPHGDAAATSAQSGADPEITAFIGKIRAVDNHSHANSVAPGDSDQDALPLEVIFPFEVPVQLRPDNPDWLAAYKALYKYPHADLSDAHMNELRGTMQRIAKEQGDKFPAWVLDQVGTEVLLTNRVAMGPGLAPPRFRWVSYVDALMLPLSTKAEAATSPDREKLFPLEEKLLQRYMSDLKVAKRPATLDAYLKTVVTPTLEAQQRGRLRRGEVRGRVPPFARFRRGPRGDREQDLREVRLCRRAVACRLQGAPGLPLPLHRARGRPPRDGGPRPFVRRTRQFLRAAGADPLLLESAFNDPTLRKTNFVIVHGGGVYAPHAGAMLWKPNVYLDMSAMTLLYTPPKLAQVLKDWLTQYPEKVLFGSDAAAFGPDMGWELAAWIATKNGRAALALALTDMIRNGEVSRARAEEIATMVMRTNAGTLYKLELK